MTRHVALALTLAALGLGVSACSTDPGASPVAPSPVTSESAEATEAAPDARTTVTLTGTVRNMNPQRRQFMLVVASDGLRPEPRVIRIDERTEVWAAGHRVRRRSLDNGMSVEVLGLDQGRFVLARKITVTRRDRR